MGIVRTELYNVEQNTTAKTFKLLSHPGRIEIVSFLLVNERQTLGQIQEHLGLSQAATSSLVKQLKDAWLVKSMQLETAVYYSLDRESWDNIRRVHQSFWDGIGDQ